MRERCACDNRTECSGLCETSYPREETCSMLAVTIAHEGGLFKIDAAFKWPDRFAECAKKANAKLSEWAAIVFHRDIPSSERSAGVQSESQRRKTCKERLTGLLSVERRKTRRSDLDIK